jgi:hypothetical protein
MQQLAKCDECGNEVHFQAWVTYDGKLVEFQESAENWCGDCEMHRVTYTVVTIDTEEGKSSETRS